MKLADFHYTKATNIYTNLSSPAQAIRTVLERAGLLEASILTLKSEVGKYKVQLQVLDIIMETKTVLCQIIEREEELIDQTESEEEQKMLNTILQRLQATLLSLVKVGGNSAGSKSKKIKSDTTESATLVLKNLYGKALKVSANDEIFIQKLLKLIKNIEEERENL